MSWKPSKCLLSICADIESTCKNMARLMSHPAHQATRESRCSSHELVHCERTSWKLSRLHPVRNLSQSAISRKVKNIVVEHREQKVRAYSLVNWVPMKGFSKYRRMAFSFWVSSFVLKILTFLYNANKESDGVIKSSTTTVKNWIKEYLDLEIFQ